MLHNGLIVIHLKHENKPPHKTGDKQMIALKINIQTAKKLNITVKEFFAIRKATKDLSLTDTFAYLNCLSDDTNDNKYAQLAATMIVSIQA